MKRILTILAMLLCVVAISAQTDNVSRKRTQKTTTTQSTTQPKKQKTTKTQPKKQTTTPAKKQTATPAKSQTATASGSQSGSGSSSAANQSPSASSNLQRILQELADNMVLVQGGTFTMGATSEQEADAYSNEKPAHSVTLSNFHICKYEVTQELWQAVMGSNPSYFKGSRKPVERVSWNDCQEFISKLNSLTGRHYRLPTEAEWEYAARGGSRSNQCKYSGSNTLDYVAWYIDNSDSRTHDVGTKAPNELGLYDMSGNVWEWCQDWWDSYSSSAQTNPTGPTSGSYRVRRGGSWGSDAWYCRVSYRGSNTPTCRDDDLGLRLAL